MPGGKYGKNRQGNTGKFKLSGFSAGEGTGSDSPLEKRPPRGRGLFTTKDNSRTYGGGPRRHRKSGDGLLGKKTKEKIKDTFKGKSHLEKARAERIKASKKKLKKEGVGRKDRKKQAEDIEKQRIIDLRNENRRKRELKKEKSKDKVVASLDTKKAKAVSTKSPKMEVKRNVQSMPKSKSKPKSKAKTTKAKARPKAKPKYDSSKYDAMLGDPSQYMKNNVAIRETTRVDDRYARAGNPLIKKKKGKKKY